MRVNKQVHFSIWHSPGLADSNARWIDLNKSAAKRSKGGLHGQT